MALTRCSLWYLVALTSSAALLNKDSPTASFPSHLRNDAREEGVIDYDISNATYPTHWNVSSHLRYRDSQSDSGYFWLSESNYGHQMPLARDGYQVFRNVKDYGARGDGISDDSAAIQSAITDGNRCGADCSATSTKGAIIYFPPGTYAISRPIVQYYYTVFVGDPNKKPTIKGLPNFEGIALIDTNVYTENGGGSNWWENQNNFYRQIRNFKIDMTDMPNTIRKGPTVAGHSDLPVGIHCGTRHVGIFQENGSGGFVSDLAFYGGKYCWVAGSQQYTGRDIKFRGCQTAIYMLWSWGWTWKNIDVQSSKIAIDASEVTSRPDRDTGRYQGTGSLTIVDSTFIKVDEVIRTPKGDKFAPSIFIENLQGHDIGSGVKQHSGKELLRGGPIDQWGLGWRFTDEHENGITTYGSMTSKPNKPVGLLRNGKFFTRTKPQYGTRAKADFLNVLRYGAKNDGRLSSASQNTKIINNLINAAAARGLIVVFPAGIYPVDDSIIVPVGARIQGALWSQIMAVGPAFGNPKIPKAVVRIGQKEGDEGLIEISDITFTTRGNTAGAVLVEWNVHEKEQGSAAMWDVIFRVGGAAGTDLTLDTCPWVRTLAKNSESDKCMASSLMLHVKPRASIYLENAWLWVADHDIEDKQQTKVNVYGARGVLLESKGPSWFHSVSNEHSTLYNWQLSGAENVYLGQIQSESPYFQAGQLVANRPYAPGASVFKGDPSFDHCPEARQPKRGNLEASQNNPVAQLEPGAGKLDTCRVSWGLRIINSSQIYIYGGGFYSLFNDYKDRCAKTGGVCQQRVIDTAYSEEIWIYSLYTVGSGEVISPQGNRYKPVPNSKVHNGFATALSSWLLLAGPGKARYGGEGLIV